MFLTFECLVTASKHFTTYCCGNRRSVFVQLHSDCSFFVARFCIKGSALLFMLECTFHTLFLNTKYESVTQSSYLKVKSLIEMQLSYALRRKSFGDYY